MERKQFIKMKSEKAVEWLKGISTLQKVILVLMLMAMAGIWPLCLVRQNAENRSGDFNHSFTEEMQQGMVITQNFRAEESYLKTIDYVLEFDAERPLKGEFRFELLGQDGKVLYSENVPYNLTPKYTYCGVEVKQWLHKGEIYQFRLTNVNVPENFPKLVYSNTEEMHAQNNCGLEMNGQVISGEALTRYTWKVPFDLERILAVWAVTGVVAWSFYEFTKKKEQSSEKE